MHMRITADVSASTDFWQIIMLSDRTRIERYREALVQLVRPGDVVADVGCGTGIMGRICLEAGARHVFMIDRSRRSLEIAEYLNALYCPGASISYCIGDATDITLPEPVDLVVSELIGTIGNDESMTEILPNFCRTNLKPDGRTCPGEIRVLGALCQWTPCMPFHKPDLPPATDNAPPDGDFTYFIETDPKTLTLLQPPQLLSVFDSVGRCTQGVHWQIPAIETKGPANALAVWFEADLAPGILLDTGLQAPRNNWGIGIFTPTPLVAEALGRTALRLAPSVLAPGQCRLDLLSS